MNVTRVSCCMLLALVALVVFSLPLAAAEKADKDGDVKVTMNDLPAAVSATLQQVVGTGTIKEIEKEADGSYSADVIKDGQKFDVEIAADGTLIKNEVEKDHKCKKDKESDEDEAVVTLSDVPAAVAATIQNAAGSGTIDKIEKKSKEGKALYEADITVDGKKLEVKVAEDGTLIKTKAEDKKDKDAKDEEGDND